MLTVLGAVILVVACVNVAGLLASRAPAREGEIAVRLSIGAGRGRIVRQLLTESALLALGGALAGAAVGFLGTLLWRQIPIPSDLTIELMFGMNRRLLLVNLAVAVTSVLVFGLAPALRTSRARLTGVLRTAGSGRSGPRMGWGRQTLVAVQIALSTVFISVTAFVYASFLDLVAAGPGVRTEGVLLMRFDTELARYGQERAQQFYERLADSARSVAGVETVSLASFIPLSGFGAGQAAIAPEGHEFPVGIESESVLTSYVGADFFRLMDVPITDGRAFGEADTAETPRVAIINQHVADRFWPGESPVGRRFRTNGADGPWVEIVGVVPTGRYFTITDPPYAFVYLPYAQAPQSRMALVTRSSGADPLELVEPLRAVVRELDPDLAVAAVHTMESLYYDAAVRSFMVFIYAIIAMSLMSVTLAFAGIYGLVASNVSQRTHEIGLRMAVGADHRRVTRMVLGQAWRVTIVGLLFGLLLTFGAEQAMGAVFPGGNDGAGREFIEYVRVVAVMLLVTGLAAYLPARRAARIEPTEALRYE
jgi:putative ABC transport system permease protein